MQRLRVPWAGSPVVGAGLSTFYQATPGDAGFADDIVAFFTAIRNHIPAGITWVVPNNGDVIEATNGELQGEWTAVGTGGVVTSNGTANFAAGVGARVVWNTGGIYRGRRVRGSTFLCPLVASAYPSNATLDDTIVAALNTAANALVTANTSLVVYSRAVEADPDNDIIGSDGEFNDITSATVPDKVTWLRSRRV